MTTDQPILRTIDQAREESPRPARKEDEHHIEFRVDGTGHPVELICTCGKTSNVEML